MEPKVSRRPIVTLLTDFGLEDAYVGAMKGVILSIAPDVTIVDLTHLVAPQAVLQGAFLIESAWRYFPPGTVHVAVVDPGVGSLRPRLAISARGQYFVGPDNGLLSAALPDSSRRQRGVDERYESRRVELPGETVTVSIESAAVLSRTVSATFEGRDVFAPAAAFLAQGGRIGDLGQRLDAIQAYAAFRAPKVEGRIDGLVIHIDRFGNLISDIRAADLPESPIFNVAGRRLTLARTYASADGTVAIGGSGGFIEIATPNGSAARELGAGAGDSVVVTG